MATPMTQSGYEKLCAEAKELENRRPGIKQAIELAREKGDLKENGDYHAAREELGMLNAKISDIQSKLQDAVIVDPNQAGDGSIALGHTVTLRRISDDREFVRTLVGVGEDDVSSGKILTTSPIGKAVMNHRVGDVVTADLPRGPEEFEIMSY